MPVFLGQWCDKINIKNLIVLDLTPEVDTQYKDNYITKRDNKMKTTLNKFIFACKQYFWHCLKLKFLLKQLICGLPTLATYVPH